MATPKNPKVFFDMLIGGAKSGRIIMELFADQAPKSAENFRCLFTGEKGLHYKGSCFHSIIPGYMCEGGDFTRGDGTGGESIYGEKFADEPFKKKHTAFTILTMENADLKRLFLTGGEHIYDGLYGEPPAFGRVVDGFSVVEKMEKVGSTFKDSVRQPFTTPARVVIEDCGEITED